MCVKINGAVLQRSVFFAKWYAVKTFTKQDTKKGRRKSIIAAMIFHWMEPVCSLVCMYVSFSECASQLHVTEVFPGI